MAAGTYTVTVSITDQINGTTVTTTSTATVSDASAIQANGVPFDATTNQADTGQTVGQPSRRQRSQRLARQLHGDDRLGRRHDQHRDRLR